MSKYDDKDFVVPISGIKLAPISESFKEAYNNAKKSEDDNVSNIKVNAEIENVEEIEKLIASGEIKNIDDAIAKIKVNVKYDDGTYKNFGEVINELSEKWKSLSDENILDKELGYEDIENVSSKLSKQSDWTLKTLAKNVLKNKYPNSSQITIEYDRKRNFGEDIKITIVY